MLLFLALPVTPDQMHLTSQANKLTHRRCNTKKPKNRTCLHWVAPFKKPEFFWPRSTSSQIIKGARGITLAEYYDLIKVGMACKTLSVLSAYFGLL